MVNSRCKIDCLECPHEKCIYEQREKERRQKYYQDHKAEIIARNNAWRKQNKEKSRLYCKRYAMKHDRTEYYREYYQRRKQNALVKNDASNIADVSLPANA